MSIRLPCRHAARALLLGAALLPLGSSPLPMARAAGAMRADSLPPRATGVYDERLKRVVIVGGTAQPGALARDRVLGWTGRRWERLTDSGPPARAIPGIGYDARQRRIVLTGGIARSPNDSAFVVVGDSWEGDSAGWRPLRAEIPPRDHQSIVFDESRGTLVMFGGIGGDRATPWPSDTWELGADGWTRIATEGPAGRGRTAMAYDRRRRQVVLFGGVGAAPNGVPQPWFADTWVFERGSWRQVADGGPRARYAHGMVYDERAGVVLLYGGAAAHRDAPLDDMWRWDGARWTEIPLSGPTPGHRYQPVMVYDRARRRTVLYGGHESKRDTWEWDGRRWREIR